jgi:hypothetical protein
MVQAIGKAHNRELERKFSEMLVTIYSPRGITV